MIVLLLNAGTGQVEQTLEDDRSGYVCSVVFSSDGNKLASASGKIVLLWNTSTGQVEQTLEGHSSGVRSVAFSSDGSQLVSASADKTLQLWNLSTGQVEHTLQGHSSWVSSVALSLNGSSFHPSYFVDMSERWVTQNGLRILYLPWDRRPGHIASKGSTLALGAETGWVTILTFSDDKGCDGSSNLIGSSLGPVLCSKPPKHAKIARFRQLIFRRFRKIS
jgi:WD40 repeat protein